MRRLAFAALMLLMCTVAADSQKRLRPSGSLLELRSRVQEDGSGSGEGSGSGDGPEADGSGSGSGSGSDAATGGEGSGAAAAAIAKASKELKETAGKLATHEATQKGLIDQMGASNVQGAFNNRELARQIRVMADTLNPPKRIPAPDDEPVADKDKCRHRSCADCVLDDECGWCLTTQQCVQGTETHPLSPVCVEYTFAACPFQCRNYESCDECTADKGCSWCQDDCSCGDAGFGACDRLYRGPNAFCPADATCPNTNAPPVMPIIPKLNELKVKANVAAAYHEGALQVARAVRERDDPLNSIVGPGAKTTVTVTSALGAPAAGAAPAAAGSGSGAPAAAGSGSGVPAAAAPAAPAAAPAAAA